MKFVHLHTHTHFSLLDGLSKIDEVVGRAKELGMDALAITDHGVMYGVIEFYKKARKAGIKPILGCEMYISENGMHDKRTGIDDKRYHLVLLAKNNTGYKNLIKLVSLAHLEGYYYKPRIDKDLLRQHSDGLIALSACLAGEVSRALISKNYEKAKRIALEYKEIFGDDYFLEIQTHPNIQDQNIVTPQIIKLSKETGIPLVATQDSHYIHAEDAHAHDVLLAVQTGNRLDDADRMTMRHDNFSLLSSQEVYDKFKYLGEEEVRRAMDNTNLIAERCSLELELGKVKLPSFPLPVGYTSANDYLAHLVSAGLGKRYSNVSNEIKQRLDYELSVIRQTGFASYFLIVQDFVNWAKSKGIVVGPGRGSAAGSLVSYLLNITDVDPLRYNLLFERFLNPERVSMPDIDLDFSDAKRKQVLDYVAHKYGKDHVAQVITFGTMAARGSIRDAGRALGLPYDFCDKIAKMIPSNPNQLKKQGVLKHCIQEVSGIREIYRTNPDAKKLIDSAAQLEGVVRHSSTHACAVVITPEPLIEYLPLQRGTEEGDIITQYEMHAVEDLGLLKMDFLGLANLTIIENALEEIKRNHGLDIKINDIPLDDQKTFRLLQTAQTTGCFQLESSGMKRYLKTLKPTGLEDIIAMVSLYRPGPLDAGMVEEYIERKHGRKKVTYLHPSMEPILKNTYGIIVYQEQLMQVANTLAKFTLPQGYMLIKAVGKKIKSLLDEQREKLVDGMVANNIQKHTAEKVWDFIEPFARYGFNRSHAACYATIAYQTAYLKANYPVEFMAAFMNSETGDVERIAFLIEECKQMGIEVLPPDINESFERFAVVASTTNKPCIRFGLTAVKNVGENVVHAIIQNRLADGPYKDAEGFTSRMFSPPAGGKDLNKKSLESLVKCGALDILGERNNLLVNLERLLNYSRDKQKQSSVGQFSLFGGNSEVSLPALRLEPSDPAQKWEKLLWEKELLGLFVSDHPLNSYQTQLRLENVIPIKNISLKTNGQQFKIGGVVTRVQKIVTKTGRPMMFSWLEDLTSKIEVIVFPNVFEKNPEAWKENSVVVARGKINDRDGSLKFLCDEVKPIAAI